ncbi:MAG: tetratricopeptide repeat protein [Planctomycetota bacterium]
MLLAARIVPLAAQTPAPHPSPPALPAPAEVVLGRGRDLLERNDPVLALTCFRRALCLAQDTTAVWPWLGRCHLELGAAALSLRYLSAASVQLPAGNLPAGNLSAGDLSAGRLLASELAALEVRARLRARDFDGALARAEAALKAERARESSELWAAYASALFRQQRNDEAAAAYRHVLALDPLSVEAHIRLGSGLTAPCEAAVSDDLRGAVTLARSGHVAAAATAFGRVLDAEEGHPIAHRLLGETLLNQRYHLSMPATATEFVHLRQAWPEPEFDERVVPRFMPGFAHLTGSRRGAARRALALFHSRLPRLVAMGGRHDLLDELERTTDDEGRASLRGRRTFDGRVWDDVRGMGGLRAATGIESLDDAAQFGFDTLAHELAHQVHLYTFTPVQRLRLRELYRAAQRRGAFLDFYAASNEAEYFGQGVEAFHCLAKRPGCEVTHGHTRFELLRVDPDLHAFIEDLVDFDSLRDASARERLLQAAAAAALRCGRWEDVGTAADMMADGPDKRAWVAVAERALLFGYPR